MLTAAQAIALTTNTQAADDATNLQNEIGAVEAKIRLAGQLGFTRIVYNSLIIGNPSGPLGTVDLTPQEETFYNTLIGANYAVDTQENTNFWTISWAVVGAEAKVNVYSVRTSLAPGSISTQTIDAINAVLTAQHPPVTAKTVVNTISGGDIPETDFGSTNSVFYEYTVVCTQFALNVIYSTQIKAALVAAGLGYNSGNVQVYKMV